MFFMVFPFIVSLGLAADQTLVKDTEENSSCGSSVYDQAELDGVGLLQLKSVGSRPNVRVSLQETDMRQDKGKACSSDAFDHSALDKLLKTYVQPPRKVKGIKSALFDFKKLLATPDDLKLLKGYIKDVGRADAKAVAHCKSFWINTYNALILWTIVKALHGKHPGLGSIRELHGEKGEAVWDVPAGKVAGRVLTLEKVLQAAAAFGDPRVHAALNCGSLSCPDLRAGAYSEGAALDKELDAQCAA